MLNPLKNGVVVLFLFCIALSSCQEPKSLVFKDFQNLTLDQLSFAGASVKVDVVYYNPNNFGLQLSRTDLDIYIDSSYFGHSAQDIQISIPKRSDFTVPIKVNLDLKNIMKNGINSFFNRNVSVKVLGNVKVGKAGIYKSFPVNYTSVQHFSPFTR